MIFKTLLEGFFNDLLNVLVEARISINEGSLTGINVTFISLSITILVFKHILLILMIIFTTKTQNIFSFLHDGIKESWLSRIFYYLHFLGFRLLYGLFIFLAQFTNSLALNVIIIFIHLSFMGFYALTWPIKSKILALMVLTGRDLNFLAT